jgi:hypothetical protein
MYCHFKPFPFINIFFLFPISFRTTLNEITNGRKEVAAGSYNPVRLNDKGDIIFLVKHPAEETANVSEEDFSVKLRWRDDGREAPALCFIDVR